jgi:hypothetical protein
MAWSNTRWVCYSLAEFFKSVLGTLYENHAVPFGSRVPTWSLSHLDNKYAKNFLRYRWKSFSLTETNWSGRCNLGKQRPLVLWIIPNTLGPCISRMIGRFLEPHRPDFDSRLIDVWFMVDKVEPGHVFLRTLPSFTPSIIPRLLDILSHNYGWLYTISETVCKCHTFKVIWKSRLISSVIIVQNVYIANRWSGDAERDNRIFNGYYVSIVDSGGFAVWCGSAATCLLWLRVRIPPGTWMSVSFECRVFPGRGLCVMFITRPEESYRM